ncbi:MAG: rRNA maturation RNase YbeY [Candidatus Buchananbacteria bacterium RIFCSPHIGHO2_02_FULL_39_17]|uniref:Endoribonuclease YbeY n=1 Tax=Candidatus Buchananbacteria bacterium RIFCSPLOWO2_01_FULL_40_23b TaxID=1797544 RepID=A0A1G1YM40_9BACT|nr:MAG: rRNA maturation RNase YbeY [Candidatus Buchananbacteria bacterium RIFCSPHIGHO2_02_FULL_39_17]OGY53418.1 MAG: rRNA maturation RNase YbeY [Candidatus Buchananbacteria bacterium RIFCSPLOWO2_01_FULL_40_23b]
MIYLEVNQKIGKKIPKFFWQFWLNKAVRILKIKKKFEVSVAVVNDESIKKLNRIFRGKNKVTDVLSFAESEGQIKFFGDKNFLGEIIICYPQAVRQAKAFRHDVAQEIANLLIHGFLHLLGYDDQTEKQSKVMEELAEKIIKGKIK